MLCCLRAAEECAAARRFDVARVHCEEARETLVRADALQVP
jgi:hypothetical protein